MNVVEQAQKIRADMNVIVETLTDERSLELISLFELWTLKTYAIGDKIRYANQLYRCVQSHTSQADWSPDVTPALWTKISIEEYPQWIQPTGAQDAYNIDDKVAHNDKHWISIISANVWEPGIYGWTEQV